MDNYNNEIAKEIREERLRLEQEMLKPKSVSRNEIAQARLVWNVGVVIIDFMTSYLIYNITGFWQYAVIWVFAGAGGLLLSERWKERIGNNRDQMKIGEDGVKVSAVAILVMALVSGGVYVTKLYSNYLPAFFEISCVCLFFYHLWNAYNFQHKDEGYINDNKEALLEESNQRRILERHRAGRLVTSHKVVKEVEKEYRLKHGNAYDEALGNDPNQ